MVRLASLTILVVVVAGGVGTSLAISSKPLHATSSASIKNGYSSATAPASRSQTTDPPTVVVNSVTPWYALLAPALVWPVLLVLVLLGLFPQRGRRIARELVGRADSIDVFGVVGVKLDSRNSGRIKRTIQGLINDYREEADHRLATLSADGGLETKLTELAETHIRPNMHTDFRCAIYVQDLVFDEGIAQITNYYPELKEGFGRVVGKWFGHVGRSFRARESRTDANVTTDPKRLVDEYGMSPEEVEPQSGQPIRQSFSCVLLPVLLPGARAAVYVDAVQADAFALPAADFEKVVLDGARVVGLADALARVVTEIQEIGLYIDARLSR